MLGLIGAGIGLVSGIGSMFSRGNANKEMERLLKQDPQRKANPLAANRLGLAQTLLNARMPGSAAMENNIFRNQANTVSSINRAATDSGTALALATEAQGKTNDQIEQLGMAEAQDYQRRYNNLGNAEEGMMREDEMQFQDSVRRFQNKVQIKGAQQQNRDSNWQSFANMGMGLANFGLQGGFNNLFGNNNAAAGRGSYMGGGFAG